MTAKRKPKTPAEPEIRRATPVPYATTANLNIREGPGESFPALHGSPLPKGTIVVPEPQPWFFVKARGSGLRGWVHSSYLIPAPDAPPEEPPTPPQKPVPRPKPVPQPKPTPPDAPPPASGDIRLRIARQIVQFEARRDAAGHLRVYQLPAGDGGGAYEVAGINDRYHPREAAQLAALIHAGKYDEAESAAAEIIASYTDVVATWTTSPPIEAYLRDSAFNRGPGGAAKILQLALGLNPDGHVGPETKMALKAAESDPEAFLIKLRAAREQYELRVAGRREKFWRGLTNRWNNALTFSETLIA